MDTNLWNYTDLTYNEVINLYKNGKINSVLVELEEFKLYKVCYTAVLDYMRPLYNIHPSLIYGTDKLSLIYYMAVKNHNLNQDLKYEFFDYLDDNPDKIVPLLINLNDKIIIPMYFYEGYINEYFTVNDIYNSIIYSNNTNIVLDIFTPIAKYECNNYEKLDNIVNIISHSTHNISIIYIISQIFTSLVSCIDYDTWNRVSLFNTKWYINQALNRAYESGVLKKFIFFYLRYGYMYMEIIDWYSYVDEDVFIIYPEIISMLSGMSNISLGYIYENTIHTYFKNVIDKMILNQV